MRNLGKHPSIYHALMERVRLEYPVWCEAKSTMVKTTKLDLLLPSLHLSHLLGLNSHTVDSRDRERIESSLQRHHHCCRGELKRIFILLLLLQCPPSKVSFLFFHFKEQLLLAPSLPQSVFCFPFPLLI